MKSLTRRQRDILDFIIEGQRKKRSPTIREIGAHFKIGNPNGVVYHLQILEAAGKIRRDFKCARGIVVLEKQGIPFFERLRVTSND